MTVSSTARHYKPVPDDYLQSALVAVRSRLAGRGVDSCPCTTTTSNGCSQHSQCGVSYCPPPPPPLPPALPCAEYETPDDFLCLGGTAGVAIGETVILLTLSLHRY
jgi:hypothetical protein